MKALTVRGFLNYEFAEQLYAEFLREVLAGEIDMTADDPRRPQVLGPRVPV